MTEAYIIRDGKVIKAEMIYHHNDSDLMHVVYTSGGLLRHVELPIEAVYFDKVTPERILEERRLME